jgi:DNA-binding protein HU-beta
MSKSQIATHIAEKFEMTRRQATEILDEIANLAYSETKKRGEFTVPGVGKLVKQQRKARTGRNPATGESIKIPAKTVVKFRVAKAAKDAVLPVKKK